jgi:hypothetical protein
LASYERVVRVWKRDEGRKWLERLLRPPSGTTLKSQVSSLKSLLHARALRIGLRLVDDESVVKVADPHR